MSHLRFELGSAVHQDPPHLLAGQLNGTAAHGKQHHIIPLEVQPGQVRPQGLRCWPQGMQRRRDVWPDVWDELRRVRGPEACAKVGCPEMKRDDEVIGLCEAPCARPISHQACNEPGASTLNHRCTDSMPVMESEGGGGCGPVGTGADKQGKDRAMNRDIASVRPHVLDIVSSRPAMSQPVCQGMAACVLCKMQRGEEACRRCRYRSSCGRQDDAKTHSHCYTSHACPMRHARRPAGPSQLIAPLCGMAS